MLFSAAGSSSSVSKSEMFAPGSMAGNLFRNLEYAPLINIIKLHDDLNWRPGNNLSDVVSTSVHIPIIFAKGTDTWENQ